MMWRIDCAACPCSQFVMFSMYALITWFGGLELSSCRWVLFCTVASQTATACFGMAAEQRQGISWHAATTSLQHRTAYTWVHAPLE